MIKWKLFVFYIYYGIYFICDFINLKLFSHKIHDYSIVVNITGRKNDVVGGIGIDHNAFTKNLQSLKDIGINKPQIITNNNFEINNIMFDIIDVSIDRGFCKNCLQALKDAFVHGNFLIKDNLVKLTLSRKPINKIISQNTYKNTDNSANNDTNNGDFLRAHNLLPRIKAFNKVFPDYHNIVGDIRESLQIVYKVYK